MRKLIILPILIFSLNAFSQDNKDAYVPFMMNGLEYKTNGIDTICIIDPMPRFKKGQDDLIKFLQKNLGYPKTALNDKIQGTVLLNFRVTKNGDIENITILKSVRDDLDQEAIRVIKKMKKWKPGEQHGRPVDVSFNFPITFRL